jgi:hypothetical protein
MSFLRGQDVLGDGDGRAVRAADEPQLAARPPGDPLHAHRVQQLASRAQLNPRVGAPPFAAQPFAVQHVGPAEFSAHAGAAEPFDGLPVGILGGIALGQQRP